MVLTIYLYITLFFSEKKSTFPRRLTLCLVAANAYYITIMYMLS